MAPWLMSGQRSTSCNRSRAFGGCFVLLVCCIGWSGCCGSTARALLEQEETKRLGGWKEDPHHHNNDNNNHIHKIDKTASRRLQETTTTKHFAAALDYIRFIDTTEETYGNCGRGDSVDAKETDDATCQERGARCTVGWTVRGEELVYLWNIVDGVTTNVDITVRLSSLRENRHIAVYLDNIQVGSVEAPGNGFDTFVDQTVQDVPLGIVSNHDSSYHEIKIVFLDGQINVCSITVVSRTTTHTTPGPAPITPAPVPITPAPVPISPPENAFRIKMYHEPGYFWQCDSDCTDISTDVDPRWCLQCDSGSSCAHGDFARLRTCDDNASNSNTLFEFVSTESGDVQIRNIGTNTCLTTNNYADKNNKMNTRMETCVNGNVNQLWYTAGYGSLDSGQAFELHPQGATKYCLTTHHHPKDGEDARVERCGLARQDKSNFFVTYYP